MSRTVAAPRPNSSSPTITAAAALESGVASETTTYDARGAGYKVADWRISDFHGENRILSLSEVVQHSSNIGIIQIAEDLGVEAQTVESVLPSYMVRYRRYGQFTETMSA